MRLAVVVALALTIGCGSGAEPGDYGGTGGADAGAGAQAGSGGSAGGGAPAADGSGVDASAAIGCNIPLAMVNGNVTSATSGATGAGSGPAAEFTDCASTGANYAQFQKNVMAGQPDGDKSWIETSLTTEPADGGCQVAIQYSRTENPWDGGVTCNETLSVTVTVAPR